MKAKEDANYCSFVGFFCLINEWKNMTTSYKILFLISLEYAKNLLIFIIK